SKSYKPGDVIKSYCGKTVEIGNTDAEGRLVLADANSYMAKNYNPEAIVNIATLTGAVVTALGYEYTGLLSSDPHLADALLQAAQISDDRAWQLPVFPELKDHVKSKIADIKNIGEARCAGTLAGGEFLRQFAQCESEKLKWAHLDIAGTSKPSKEIAYFDNGATGAGVRLLTQFLIDRSQKS
ncbi:MAG: leucyl aminopeptidase family protein, partial [Candidatus Hinthialibacter sp.]